MAMESVCCAVTYWDSVLFYLSPLRATCVPPPATTSIEWLFHAATSHGYGLSNLRCCACYGMRGLVDNLSCCVSFSYTSLGSFQKFQVWLVCVQCSAALRPSSHWIYYNYIQFFMKREIIVVVTWASIHQLFSLVNNPSDILYVEVTSIVLCMRSTCSEWKSKLILFGSFRQLWLAVYLQLWVKTLFLSVNIRYNCKI
jgi:hypothetical protein